MNQYNKVKLFKDSKVKGSHTSVEHIHIKQENIKDNVDLVHAHNQLEVQKNENPNNNSPINDIKEDIDKMSKNEDNFNIDHDSIKDNEEMKYSKNHEDKLYDVQSKIIYYLEEYYNILNSKSSSTQQNPKEINNIIKNDVARDSKKFFSPRYKKDHSLLQHEIEFTTSKHDFRDVELIEELDELTYCIDIMKGKDLCNRFSYENNLIPGLKILEAQELERGRIARDLHDTTVQTLTNLVHRTELCMRLIDSDTIRVKLDLQVMMQCLKDVINDMRLIIYDLRPMSLDDLGLETTLSRYVSNLQLTTRINITCQIQGTLDHLDSVMSLTIYQIIQEATVNSVKHSSASQIDIMIASTEDNIEFSIIDNGKGFCYNKDTRENSTNFGLSIMRERVCLLKGEIDIISNCNEGTKVIVSLPLE